MLCLQRNSMVDAYSLQLQLAWLFLISRDVAAIEALSPAFLRCCNLVSFPSPKIIHDKLPQPRKKHILRHVIPEQLGRERQKKVYNTRFNEDRSALKRTRPCRSSHVGSDEKRTLKPPPEGIGIWIHGCLYVHHHLPRSPCHCS